MRLKLQSILKNGLIIVAGAAVVALITVEVAVAIIAIKFFAIFAAAQPPASAAAVRDEVEVRAVAYAFEEAINDADYDTWSALVCKQMLARFDKGRFLEISVSYRELDTGGLFITIDSIVVTGDTAIGNVMMMANLPSDVHFVREDGYWKWCAEPPNPR